MVSVSEHVVMMILSLVRNYMPAHKQICDGDWNVAEIARKYVPLPDHNPAQTPAICHTVLSFWICGFVTWVLSHDMYVVLAVSCSHL